MWPTAIITIRKYLIGSWWCVNRSILRPSGPSVKSKSQLYLCASYEYLTLTILYNTTWKSKQKNCTNFDHYWTKNWSFLCMQTNWVCWSEALRFCKNDSDSSRVILSKNVTRVESSHHFSQRGSSRVRVTKNRDLSQVESIHWLESRYHCLLVQIGYGLLCSLWVWRRKANRRPCFPPVSNPSTSWTAWLDSCGRWDNRMAAQHLPRDLVQFSSGLKKWLKRRKRIGLQTTVFS